MRVLIAVQSYAGDAQNGNHQLIRQTWGNDFPKDVDVRFMIGRRGSDFVPQMDEILVDFQKEGDRTCQHAWWEAFEECGCICFWQQETRDILRWSIEQNYDYTFLCSTDTYLIPRKLMATGFENYDYSGHFIPRDMPLGTKSLDNIYAGHRLYLWAEVGCGFFISKRASEIVLTAAPDFWYQDVHIGQILGPKIESGEIKAVKLEGFVNQVSWHFRDQNGEGYQQHGSGWMKEMHMEHRNDGKSAVDEGT
jgi:hypothetical protein